MSEPADQPSLPTSSSGLPQPELVERMQLQVNAWQDGADARAIFLQCYMLMTRNMFAAMEQGEFYDMMWVRSLLHRFAEHYFNALDAYEKDPDSALKVWHLTHQAAAHSDTLVIQNLMLGINAHINYDLVFALVELLENEWSTLSPAERHIRYADHSHVNHVIGRTIDTVQEQVIGRLVPAFFLVDNLLGSLDEWMAERLISMWRDTVWHQAVQLLDCISDTDREALRFEVEQLTLKRAATILMTKDFPGSDTLPRPT